MPTRSEKDNYLTIQLLSFDRPTDLTERYYFLEMSTLQATTLLPQDRKIISSEIVAYTDNNKYLDEQTAINLKTIGDFNNLFLNNPGYYIHNCSVELEDGLNIHSHDDGEVSVQFTHDNSSQTFINRIFEKYNLDKALIHTLKNKPGHYLSIDLENNITADFEDFDDYIKNGRD